MERRGRRAIVKGRYLKQVWLLFFMTLDLELKGGHVGCILPRNSMVAQRDREKILFLPSFQSQVQMSLPPWPILITLAFSLLFLV